MSFLRLRASTSVVRSTFASSSAQAPAISRMPIVQPRTSVFDRIRSFSSSPVVEKIKTKTALKLRVKPMAGGWYKRWKGCGHHGLTSLTSARQRRLGQSTTVATRMMRQNMRKMLPHTVRR